MSGEDPLGDALDGVAHLQAAGLELIAAARSFLDAAEATLADPDQARRAAAALAAVVGAYLEAQGRPGRGSRDDGAAGGGLRRVDIS
ncbi:MAG: hypothetical protein RIE08_00205 [Acidimicrobiales bacterium]